MEIVFENVSYSYNYKTPIEKVVFNKLNLSIEKNKISGIIGKSGSGKTTLLELINGLIIPNNGNLEVGQYRINNNDLVNNYKKLRNEVGLVFQFPEEQFFTKTVREELLFALTNYTNKIKLEDRAIKALKMVGLNENYLDKNPFYLSAGEKRRVAIASVLIMNHKVILFDEPTVGLDYNGKKNLMNIIKRLNIEYNKTIVIASHDVDMLYQMVDNIVVLSDNKVLISGTKEEVYKHVGLLSENNIAIPNIVNFINKAKILKGIKLGNHIDIRDLIKDIYRNV